MRSDPFLHFLLNSLTRDKGSLFFFFFSPCQLALNTSSRYTRGLPLPRTCDWPAESPLSSVLFNWTATSSQTPRIYRYAFRGLKLLPECITRCFPVTRRIISSMFSHTLLYIIRLEMKHQHLSGRFTPGAVAECRRSRNVGISFLNDLWPCYITNLTGPNLPPGNFNESQSCLFVVDSSQAIF
ncbi:hypothetical protein BDN67DRAFT_728420 [Paxillus ammoniavirescens]|nr:hypothetical protein BDN67DRAFT_728420 [Paxillus ammoniavirescens]